ncbi:Glycosyl transferase, group 1 [hydrothermal vent metagenome]|uniref:Glycosyl transferase, group 1 n=1 Tax=hydrothermal vent metagenome TaxID=652676 RepID=A0A3B1DNM4_9ZZZZ
MPDSFPKVLLLAGKFEVRGSSLYTLRMAERLNAEGIEARIVCSNAARVESSLRKQLQIQEYSYLDQPLIGRLVLEWLLRDLIDDPPDLIHIQSFRLFRQGVRLANMLNCPYLLTLHSALPPGVRFRFEGEHVVTVSQSVKQKLIEQTSLPEKKITVIHPGVETEYSSNLRTVLNPEHRPVVGTAGPLESVKGIPFFLHAAAAVAKEFPDIEFLVAGGGPDEQGLRKLARNLKIAKQVTFAPNVYDFAASLNAMDIFCLPSIQQGLGTIMLEAMSLGKPVIGTSVGGISSVIQDNETGLIVPPSNSTQLKDRIVELLKDPVQARAIGEAGRQLVKNNFRLEKMVRMTANLYRNILATRQQSVPFRKE